MKVLQKKTETSYNSGKNTHLFQEITDLRYGHHAYEGAENQISDAVSISTFTNNASSNQNSEQIIDEPYSYLEEVGDGIVPVHPTPGHTTELLPVPTKETVQLGHSAVLECIAGTDDSMLLVWERTGLHT